MLDIAPERIVRKGRLQPGRMFLVDTAKGQLVDDDEIKAELAAEHPYEEWLGDDQIRLDELPARTMLTPAGRVVSQQRLFGYTTEELPRHLGPHGTHRGRAPWFHGFRRLDRRALGSLAHAL